MHYSFCIPSISALVDIIRMTIKTHSTNTSIESRYSLLIKVYYWITASLNTVKSLTTISYVFAIMMVTIVRSCSSLFLPLLPEMEHIDTVQMVNITNITNTN